jgi:hypothetical protein
MHKNKSLLIATPRERNMATKHQSKKRCDIAEEFLFSGKKN